MPCHIPHDNKYLELQYETVTRQLRSAMSPRSTSLVPVVDIQWWIFSEGRVLLPFESG